MAKASFLFFHGDNSGDTSRDTVANYEEERKDSFQHNWNHNIVSLATYRIDDRVGDETHNCDIEERREGRDPLRTDSVKELETVQCDEINLLTAVLAAFEVEIVLHGFLFVLLGHVKIFLCHLFCFIFFGFDVTFSNLDKCIFQAVQFNIDLGLDNSALNLTN